MNFLSKKFLTLPLLLISKLIFVDYLIASEVIAKQNENVPTSEYIKKIPDSSFYILGPGDELSIEVKEDDTPDLNINFAINGEGIAKLKRLKRIYVEGLTIGELTDILNKEYSAYVKEPDVELLIVKYRPIKVFIDGEVTNPGFYVLPGSSSPSGIENINLKRSKEIDEEDDFNQNDINLSNNQNTLTNTNRSNILNNVFFPSVIDLIRRSGGINTYADLTNVEITKINSISNGGGRLKTKVNIIDALDLVDTSQNIRIYDGVTVFIPKSKTPTLSQFSKAIRSNLNPKFVNIFIAGKVENPGRVTVSKSSVLHEALSLAGGVKTLRGKINFLRYNNDGSIDQRRFRYKRNATRGSFNNPYLRSGDIIYIGKGNFNILSEILREVTSPLQSITTTYSTYKIISD